jgi:hypothetical protein
MDGLKYIALAESIVNESQRCFEITHIQMFPSPPETILKTVPLIPSGLNIRTGKFTGWGKF